MSDMKVLVVEVDENSETMLDLRRYPAVSSSSIHSNVFYIKDDKIVGEGKICSFYGADVRVTPLWEDATTAEFFKDAELAHLGTHMTHRFDMITGDYVGTYPDEPASHGEGIRIVDKFEFQLGIASPLRYGKIEGYGYGKR